MAKPLLKKRTLKPGIHIVTVRLGEEESQHLKAVQQKRARTFRRVVPYQEIMIHGLMGVRAVELAKTLSKERESKPIAHVLTIRLGQEEMEHLKTVQQRCAYVPYQAIMVQCLMELPR